MRAAQHRFNYFGFSWGAFFEWLCLHILVQVLWRNSETRANRTFSRSKRRHKGVPQPLYNWRMCVKNSPDNRKVVYRINKTTNNTRLIANIPLAKLCMGKIYDSGAAVCNLTSRKPFAKRMGLGVRRRGDFGSILERINPLWVGVRWNMQFLRVFASSLLFWCLGAMQCLSVPTIVRCREVGIVADRLVFPEIFAISTNQRNIGACIGWRVIIVGLEAPFDIHN